MINRQNVKPLCIILPQISGYIKYFDNGGKNMSFMIKDDRVLVKYDYIQDKIKQIKDIQSHINHVYDEKYIKAKVKKFNGVVNAKLLGDEVPKEGVHYNCIPCINIDFVMKMNKKIIHKFTQKNARIK